MNPCPTKLEQSLKRAELRWRAHQLLDGSLRLGAAACVVALLFCVSVLAGWVVTRQAAIVFLAVTALMTLLAWAVTAVRITVRCPDRASLAAAIEKKDRRFLDRLNTLHFLTCHASARQRTFITRIASQTQAVAEQRPPRLPLRFGPLAMDFAVFALLLGLVAMVYHKYDPIGRLHGPHYAAHRPEPQNKNPNLASAPTNPPPVREWGEVKISEPGRDTTASKIDVIPLRIEVAVSGALKLVSYATAVNGGNETTHPLPPPAEPKFATFEPTLYLDEMRLSDWDVVTYYALAQCQDSNRYASQIYFLEIRPFREDILKMPGGEAGKPMQKLNEMSGLVKRQQHVIRETHQFVQQPPAEPKQQFQDRNKLAGAEQDLSQAARHLYAQMSTEMENAPIGETLDNLAQAEKALTDASQALVGSQLAEAQNCERTALLNLIAARKIFQKAVSDSPQSFQGGEEGDQETPPVVADESRKLKEMAEFRNETKAAQDFLRKTADQQKQIENQTTNPLPDYDKLARQQSDLNQAFRDFEQMHPQVFSKAQAETKAAHQAMSKAAEALKRQSGSAEQDARTASEHLGRLSTTLANQAEGKELADAYQLKKLLEQQAKKFDQAAGGASLPDEELAQTAAQTRDLLEELSNKVDNDEGRQFGKELRDALTPAARAQLEQTLDKLRQPHAEQVSRDLAGAARDNLQALSKAFGQSQPSALRESGQNPDTADAPQKDLAKGMAELDSLIKQLQNQNLSQEDLGKQAKQALYNLQLGLRTAGDNDGGNQLAVSLNQALTTEKGLEPGNLQRLMDELQRYSLQLTSRNIKKEDKPELTSIDPARLPAAYRSRIQRYFQKLSEQ